MTSEGRVCLGMADVKRYGVPYFGRRDAESASTKWCRKLLQFDVLTTLSLTILVYLHSFSCCCVRNLQNREKFSENSNLQSSRSSKVIDLGVNRKRILCNFLLVINSNFGRISYSFRDIDTFRYKIACFPHDPPHHWLTPPIAEECLALST